MRAKFCYLNGRLLPEEKASVSIHDSGFLYGDGVFETMRAYSGRVFMLGAHIARMKRGLKWAGIGFEPAHLPNIIHRLLKKNRIKDAVVRVSVTRGNTRGMLPWEMNKRIEPTVLVLLRGVPDTTDIIRQGVNIIFVKEEEFGIFRPGGVLKTMSNQHNILARLHARKRGAFEAIFLNRDGYITEGTSTNIFFIKKRTLLTPDTSLGILPGITRHAVLGIARRNGIKIKEGYFSKEELLDADSVFLTNTSMGISPVRIGKGSPKNELLNFIIARYMKMTVP